MDLNNSNVYYDATVRVQSKSRLPQPVMWSFHNKDYTTISHESKTYFWVPPGGSTLRYPHITPHTKNNKRKTHTHSWLSHKHLQERSAAGACCHLLFSACISHTNSPCQKPKAHNFRSLFGVKKNKNRQTISPPPPPHQISHSLSSFNPKLRLFLSSSFTRTSKQTWK